MPRQYLTSWKSRNTLTGVHFQLCLDGWYLWVIVLKFNFYSQFCFVHANLRSKCKRLSPPERKPCCVFHLLGVYSMNSKDPRRQGFITYSAVGRSICTGTYSMGYSVHFHLTAKGCKIWWRNIIYAESAQLCICCHCIFMLLRRHLCWSAAVRGPVLHWPHLQLVVLRGPGPGLCRVHPAQGGPTQGPAGHTGGGGGAPIG